jgi:hypothetical protein
MQLNTIKDIESLIHQYFEGIYYGDTLKLKASFSKNAYIHGAIASNSSIKTVEAYIAMVKARKSPSVLGEKFKMSIIGIEVLDRTAMVKLHVPILGYNYYDYLSLFKIDNSWQIVHKLYAHVD